MSNNQTINMRKIISVNNAIKISKQIRQEGRAIVLAGGCFDILHAGHLKFLKAAKKQGDILIILLESDENIKKIKGVNRPINPQKERAIILSAIPYIDFIVLLGKMTKDKDYDRLMIQIKPDIVAMTDKDPQIEQRKKQCEMVSAELRIVIKKIDNVSTSSLIQKYNNGKN